MKSKFRTYSTLAVFIVLISSGQCQFSGLSGMSSMLGSMNPSMLSSMNSGMFGSGSSSMMSSMGGMGGFPGLSGMGSLSSSMMMPGMMILGQAMNDPLMSLAMGTIELNPTELMILNNLVQTIVGPGATVNPALMVLYSSEGGLPLNAAKMIPYITIMQGMAKDLKIKVPGVPGEATKEQIENHIFQRSLQWMQQRNMAGAFSESAGMFLMSNAMNGGNPFLSSSPSSSSATANNAAATARAAASARESLAKFLQAQTDKTASSAKPASSGTSSSSSSAATKSATPKPPPALSKELVAQMIAASNSQQPTLPAGIRMNMPTGMNFPAGMSMPMGMSSGLMSSGGSSSTGNAAMNPANMMAMEMLGF